MSATMDLDEALDDRALRAFIDGLPRQGQDDAAVAAFLASTPLSALLLRAASSEAEGGSRFARDALRRCVGTPTGAAALVEDEAIALLLGGAAHGAAAVRAETARVVAAAAKAAADVAPLAAACGLSLGALLGDASVAVAEQAALALGELARRGAVGAAAAAVEAARASAASATVALRVCDCACRVAVLAGGAAWDAGLLAGPVALACGPSDDPLSRLSALEVLGAAADSPRAVGLLCAPGRYGLGGAAVDALVALAADDGDGDAYGVSSAALRCASRVLAAGAPRPAAAGVEGWAALPSLRAFLGQAFSRLARDAADDGPAADADYDGACVALGAWLYGGGAAAARALIDDGGFGAPILDGWLAAPLRSKRRVAARLGAAAHALAGAGAAGPDLWRAASARGLAAAVAARARDGDDAVRRAALGCGAAALRAAPDAALRDLLGVDGFYEHLVTPGESDGESARLKHALLAAASDAAAATGQLNEPTTKKLRELVAKGVYWKGDAVYRAPQVETA